MNRERNPNLLGLEQAVDWLGSLADEMVFLGGMRHGFVADRCCSTPGACLG